MRENGNGIRGDMLIRPRKDASFEMSLLHWKRSGNENEREVDRDLPERVMIEDEDLFMDQEDL